MEDCVSTFVCFALILMETYFVKTCRKWQVLSNFGQNLPETASFETLPFSASDWTANRVKFHHDLVLTLFVLGGGAESTPWPEKCVFRPVVDEKSEIKGQKNPSPRPLTPLIP